MVSVAKGMSPSHPFDYNHVQVWLMRLQGFPLASVDDCGILFECRYGLPFLFLASFWSGQIKKKKRCQNQRIFLQLIKSSHLIQEEIVMQRTLVF